MAVCLIFTFASCKDDSPATFESYDKDYTLTANNVWEDVEGKLNSSAIIELANFKNGTYLVVIPYPAELFPTVADFAVNIAQSVPQWYSDADIQEPMTYKYDDMTYYKIYATDETQAMKFNMTYDEVNYLLSISYTDNDEKAKTRLDETDAIIHSMTLINAPSDDTTPDNTGDTVTDTQQ